MKFLEDERTEREAYVLTEKVRKTMYVDDGKDGKGKLRKENDKPGHFVGVNDSNPDVPKCKV